VEEIRASQSRADYSVGIGFPCGATIPWQTTMSLTRTIHALTLLRIPVNIHAIAGSSDVVIARDVVLTNFLTCQEKFLFWIDSDIAWNPEDFIRVLRLSKDLGVVCAPYPLKREPAECVVNFVHDPVVLDSNGCAEIYSTGLGFVCIRRDIVDQFAATKRSMRHTGNDRMILDAFRRDVKGGADGVPSAVGEDCAFFDDLRALGRKAWLVPSITLDHIGSKAYRVPPADSSLTAIQ